MDEQRDGGTGQDPRTRDASARDGGGEPVLGGGERLQDRRRFTVDPVSLPFFALSDSVPTDRWFGTLDGAGYRIEVPINWNGQLVVYAHDYQGVGPALSVRSPSLRQHLIEHGYAWAASSFARNYYDVRAAIEDSNALALAFVRIARENGRELAEPVKRYVVGDGMGGHMAGAAVERETEQTARSKVHYHGALAMCGAMADIELFRYFAAYQTAAHTLANAPIARWPVSDYGTVRTTVINALFSQFPLQTTPAGDRLRAVVMNLTGGARPVFEQGFSTNEQSKLWSAFAGESWVHGVLRSESIETRAVVYQLDGDPALSVDEEALNRAVFRVPGDSDAVANPLQPDGLRWVPAIAGEIAVPVVSIHTLGDVLVPFSMQQIYRQRTLQKGTSDLLVQRAIRAAGHCDFTLAEQIAAFDALVAWEQTGVKPAGDEVLDPAVISMPNYGCAFTVNNFTLADASEVDSLREMVPPCTP